MQFHQRIQFKGFVPGCIYPLPLVGVSRMSYLSRALERLEVTAEHRIHVPPEFRFVWGEGKADFFCEHKGGIFQPPFPIPSILKLLDLFQLYPRANPCVRCSVCLRPFLSSVTPVCVEIEGIKPKQVQAHNISFAFLVH